MPGINNVKSLHNLRLKQLVLEPALVEDISFSILNHKQDRGIGVTISFPPICKSSRELFQRRVGRIVVLLGEMRRNPKVPVG
jgi:hypothetical protein